MCCILRIYYVEYRAWNEHLFIFYNCSGIFLHFIYPYRIYFLSSYFHWLYDCIFGYSLQS